MPIKIQLFVEGKSDKKFISDYLDHLGLNDVEIIPLKGKGEVKNIPAPRLEKNQLQGVKNGVIIDADKDKEESLKELKKYANFNLFDEIFFFPNDRDPGALEVVLENCMSSTKKQDFEHCWFQYESCLDNFPQGFRGPFAKSKVYAYLESVSPVLHSKFQGIDKVDFKDSSNWDLNVSYLDPLKMFLTKL
ncbi:DUF3226 domain-containing protein [Fluviicola sp.]|jgi:hypothetical protein|uniref:DUF3226 domain-containing protein n=1 Tax=Fluviicola sp. TaxID=1917219 RepID=UPI00281AFAD7|nr:DUF3226 domain-containing protein [Fluviicola sp.]MDR0803224.1 hypothetical protein [Fluviicola sp.]